MSRLEFPLPYENFDKEAKLRVYEQDLNTLKWNLKSYSTYTKSDIDSVSYTHLDVYKRQF